MKTLQTTLLLAASLCTLGCQTSSFNSFRGAFRSQKDIAEQELAGLAKDAPQSGGAGSQSSFASKRSSLSSSGIQQASAEFEFPSASSVSASPKSSLTHAATSDSVKLMEQGQLHESKGQLDQAVNVYQQVLVVHPNNARAHHRLAVIADIQKHFSEAEQHYRAALREKPLDADLLSDLGYSYLLQNRYAESQTYLDQAIQIDSDHTRALNNLGLLFAKQGARDQALAQFRKTGSEAEAQRKLASISPGLSAASAQVASASPVVANPFTTTSGTTASGIAASGATSAPPASSRATLPVQLPPGLPPGLNNTANSSVAMQQPTRQVLPASTTAAQPASIPAASQGMPSQVSAIGSGPQAGALPVVGASQNATTFAPNPGSSDAVSYSGNGNSPAPAHLFTPPARSGPAMNLPSRAEVANALPEGARNPFAFNPGSGTGPASATAPQPHLFTNSGSAVSTAGNSTTNNSAANSMPTWPPQSLQQPVSGGNQGSVNSAPASGMSQQPVQPAGFNQPVPVPNYRQPQPGGGAASQVPAVNSLPAISPQSGFQSAAAVVPPSSGGNRFPAQSMPAGMHSASPWGNTNQQSSVLPATGNVFRQNVAPSSAGGQPVQQTAYNAAARMQMASPNPGVMPPSQGAVPQYLNGQNGSVLSGGQGAATFPQTFANPNGTVTTPINPATPRIYQNQGR